MLSAQGRSALPPLMVLEPRISFHISSSPRFFSLPSLSCLSYSFPFVASDTFDTSRTIA